MNLGSINKNLRRSKEWEYSDLPPPKKVQESAMKVMLPVFWYCRGVIYWGGEDQTITSTYHRTLLNKLRDALIKKQCSMIIKNFC